MLSKKGKEKIHAIKSTNEFKQKMHNIISSDKVQRKTKQTNFERYGEISPMRCAEIRKKVDMTKKKNNSFKTSKPEDILYELLCEKFSKTDVIRQYTDNRYPFKCDFYIKALDLFIELNASWTHDDHWFNPNDKNDLAKIDEWHYEATAHHKLFYFSAIETWTKRDIEKRNIAIKNKLNYIVFWNNDLSDAILWLENI